MDGADGAAAAAESIQTTLARLQVDVGRYSALRLAAVVLQRGIERYREKNQGPDSDPRRPPVRRLDRRFVRRPPDRRRRRRGGAQRGPARWPAGRRRRHEQRLARPALPGPAAGQPRIVAPGARADPVRRRRHPPEFRRSTRPGRTACPRRAIATHPGALLHPPPAPGRARGGEPAEQCVVRARASLGDGGGTGRAWQRRSKTPSGWGCRAGSQA